MIEVLKTSGLKMPERSKWTCHLFGGVNGSGVIWTPNKGEEPNWFWRWTQYWAFGNRWERRS